MAGPGETDRRSAEKYGHPSFKVIYLTVFLDFLANGIVLPVLQGHARSKGASGFNVGMVFTAYSAAQIPGSLLFGRVSDFAGRRPVILISLLMSSVTLWLTTMAPDLNSLIWARALAGFFSETSVCQAYIADKTTREQRPSALGHMGAFIGLGFMIGPATGAVLGLMGGFDLAANFTAVITFVNLIYAFRKLDESLGYDTGEKEPKSSSGFGAYVGTVLRPVNFFILLSQFVITTGLFGWHTTFALWAKDRLGWEQRHVGWMLAWNALGHFMAMWRVRSFAKDPNNSSRGGVVGCGLLAAGLASHQFIGWWPGLFPPLFALGFGYALAELVNQALISVHSPKELQGSMLGTLSSSQAFARVVAPVATGYLFDNAPGGDRDYPYTCLAALPVLGALLTLVAYSQLPSAVAATKSE